MFSDIKSGFTSEYSTPGNHNGTGRLFVFLTCGTTKVKKTKKLIKQKQILSIIRPSNNAQLLYIIIKIIQKQKQKNRRMLSVLTWHLVFSQYPVVVTIFPFALSRNISMLIILMIFSCCNHDFTNLSAV